MSEHKELLQQADNFVAATQEDVNPRWYPQVHLAPAAGWINDPKGVRTDCWRVVYEYFEFLGTRC